MYGIESSIGGAYFNADRRLDEGRLAAANAFNQFRQLNPHATLDDLQMASQQIYGPNVWLHGAPTGQMMQGIAERNAQAKAYADQMNSVKLAQEQVNMQRGLLETATNIAGRSPDPATAAANFYSMFGNVPNIQRYISPETIATLHQREQVSFASNNTNLETAIGLLESGKDVRGNFPGIPESAVAALEARAKAEIERRKTDRERKQEMEELEKIRLAAQLGTTYELPQNVSPETRRRLEETKNTTFGRLRADRIREEVARIDQDVDVMNQARSSGPEAVRAAISRRLDQALGPFGAASREEVDNAVMAVMQKVGTVQRQEWEKANETATTAASTMAQQSLERSRTLAKGELSNQEMFARNFGSGPAAQAAKEALESVLGPATGYVSPEALAEIGRFVKSSEFRNALGSSPSSARALQLLMQKFPNAISPNGLQNAQSELRRSILMERGAFEPQDAGQYTTSTMSALRSSREADSRRTAQNVAEILANNTNTPQRAREQLLAMRAKLVAAEQSFSREMEARVRSAGQWSARSNLTGRVFTQEDAAALTKEFQTGLKEQLDNIDAALERVPQTRESAGPQAPGMPGAPRPAGQVSAAPVETAQGSFASVAEATQSPVPRSVSDLQLNQQAAAQAARSRVELQANPRFRQLMVMREQARQAGDVQRVRAIETMMQQMMSQ